MNLNATIETEANASQAATGIPESDLLHGRGLVESWLHHHLQAVALAVTAAGFVVRMLVARGSYLNPDEALHYLMINQPSLFLAYKASLTNAHPPLIYLVVYFFRFLGRSELMLRLPSVLAGTAFCWACFKWIEMVFGRAAGLIGLVILAFTPATVALSAELREYALLLFCMATALFFLERTFREQSVRSMWCFSLFLYLAILSHYSAVFFVLTAGLYVLARIADRQLTRKLVTAWAAGQLGGVAIYLFLYVTHLSKIKNSIALWAVPFDQTFFHLDGESIFHFTRVNTWDIFLYVFGERYVSGAILLCFLVGIAILLARDFAPGIGKSKSDSSHLGLLLLLPFVSVWAAAIAGIYPYVGSRHTAFLVPFAVAAASFLLASLSRQKLWAGLLLAILLAGVSSVYGQSGETGFSRVNQSRKLMAGAVGYMEQSIPRGDLILVDYQSSLPLSYYLCGPAQTISIDRSSSDFDQFNCNGYSVVSLHFWKLKAESLAAPFEKVVHARGMKPGDRVWVFQAGWGDNLILAELPEHFPQFRCLAPRTFGENISVIPFVVGPELSPAAPPFAACRN